MIVAAMSPPSPTLASFHVDGQQSCWPPHQRDRVSLLKPGASLEAPEAGRDSGDGGRGFWRVVCGFGLRGICKEGARCSRRLCLPSRPMVQTSSGARCD